MCAIQPRKICARAQRPESERSGAHLATRRRLRAAGPISLCRERLPPWPSFEVVGPPAVLMPLPLLHAHAHLDLLLALARRCAFLPLAAARRRSPPRAATQRHASPRAATRRLALVLPRDSNSHCPCGPAPMACLISAAPPRPCRPSVRRRSRPTIEPAPRRRRVPLATPSPRMTAARHRAVASASRMRAVQAEDPLPCSGRRSLARSTPAPALAAGRRR